MKPENPKGPSGKPKRAAKRAKAAPAVDSALVAEVYQLPEEFPFPGMPAPAPVPASLADLAEMIRSRAGRLENPIAEGMAEFHAGRLAVELVEWLTGRAAEGSRDAQASLVELADKAVGRYLWSIMQGHEVTTKRARMAPDIPGRMSLNPEVSEYWQTFLRLIRQGSETRVPMEIPAGKCVSSRNIRKAKHQLAAALHDFMVKYRMNGHAPNLSIPPDHAAIPELGRKILKLPPFALENEAWKDWRDVGWEIVEHYTKGNPARHEAFNRRPLASMLKDKTSIWKALDSAWKSLAS